MVGFTVVDDFGDQLATNQDVDRLDVQVHDFVVAEVPQSMDEVEQEADFGPKGDGFVSGQDKEVEFFSLEVLHEERVGGIDGSLHAVVFGDEVRAAPFEFGHDVLLVFQLMDVFFLQLGLQLLHGQDPVLSLLIGKVTGAVHRTDIADVGLRDEEVARAADRKGTGHCLLHRYLHRVENVVVYPLFPRELGHGQQST